MKNTIIALLSMAYIGTLFAQTNEWSFDLPNKEWKPWGWASTSESTPEKLAEVITNSNESPHSGTGCLILRDQLTTLNPYMVPVKPIPANAEGHYVFSGFARSTSAIPIKFKAGVQALSAEGDFLGWVAMEEFGTASEWVEFKIETKKLPPQTTQLVPSVFPHAENDMKAIGEIYLDDLSFKQIESKSEDIRTEFKSDYSRWFEFKLGLTRTNHPLVDLSSLLHRPAGKHGFVQSRNGHFLFSDGTPARFLGTNIHAYDTLFPTHEQAEAVADTLARYGINIVRLHLPEKVLIDPKKTSPSRMIDDEEKWDRFDFFVKTLKDRGVYILIDSVTGMSSDISPVGAGRPASEEYKNHRSWSTYEPKLLEYAKQYLRDLLTHVNKYTGVRLADEPAIAMLMLINEQSAFFDWYKSEPDYFKQLYTGMFNDFLKQRYGTKDQFLKAWTDTNGHTVLQKDEDFDQGTIRPVPVHSLMGGNVQPTAFLSTQRVQDTLRFMQGIQTRFNDIMKAQLAEIGCKIPVASTNVVFHPAELSTHQSMDYTSHNGYFDHAVLAKPSGWKMSNIPIVKICQPRHPAGVEPLIAAVKLYDKPATTTENDMMYPHEWRSSYLPWMISNAALQDWDAMFQYAFAGGFGFTWDSLFAAKTILKPTNEFNDPAIMGTFPAVALLFYRRDVQPSKNLVRVLYDENDKLSPATLRTGLFPFNYLTWVSRIESTFDGNVDGADVVLASTKPESGKALFVPFRYGGSTDSNIKQAENLDSAMKKAGLLKPSVGLQLDKIISDTGEIERDWTRGLLKINTPRTRGFSGFPNNKLQQFGDITLSANLPFATVFLSSLTDLSLDLSDRALLTTISRAENNTDRKFYSKAIQENGFTRFENITVEPGQNGEVVTEIVSGKLIIPGRSVRMTPLSGDMTAAAAPAVFHGKDGKVEVTFGKENPSIWYLLEITH